VFAVTTQVYFVLFQDSRPPSPRLGGLNPRSLIDVGNVLFFGSPLHDQTSFMDLDPSRFCFQVSFVGQRGTLTVPSFFFVATPFNPFFTIYPPSFFSQGPSGHCSFFPPSRSFFPFWTPCCSPTAMFVAFPENPAPRPCPLFLSSPFLAPFSVLCFLITFRLGLTIPDTSSLSRIFPLGLYDGASLGQDPITFMLMPLHFWPPCPPCPFFFHNGDSSHLHPSFPPPPFFFFFSFPGGRCPHVSCPEVSFDFCP